MTTFTEQDFSDIASAAHYAGTEAFNAAKPRPMIVTDGYTDYVIDGGVCGFAWIEIRGNTSFGKWAKKAGIATKAYPSGLMIWVRTEGQSMERKVEYARAYARVLNNHGIDARVNSRLD